MKLFAAVLAALAAAVVSANQADGPCTMQLAASDGADCATINPCLSTVTLAPGSSANSAAVTFTGDSCMSGTVVSSDASGAASMSVASGTGRITIFGDDTDVPKGFAAFIYMDSSNSATCVGSLRVTDGTCMYSDAGPDAPSAAAGTVASVAGLAAAAVAGTAALLL